jgi:hypothetical protein
MRAGTSSVKAAGIVVFYGTGETPLLSLETENEVWWKITITVGSTLQMSAW